MNNEKEVIFKVTRSIKKKDHKDEFCLHHAVVVDEKTRTIECSRCNAIVDAFDYVLRWARDESNVEMNLRYLKREQKALQDEIIELKKEVSYIKRKRATTGHRQLTQEPQQQLPPPSWPDSPF